MTTTTTAYKRTYIRTYINHVPGNPLSVSTVNPRYLVDSTGAPVYLVGFHTWGDIQDGDSSDPPDEFDWDAYLSALLSYGCNFTKLWCHETGRGWSDITNYWFSPPRYERTGPGNDADGKLKFDLAQVNQDYLFRLRNRAIECAHAGIYVCVQLFDGWSMPFGGSRWPVGGSR